MCCGYFSRVDREQNKCGKMTYFVEKLNISQMLSGRVACNRPRRSSRAGLVAVRRRTAASHR